MQRPMVFVALSSICGIYLGYLTEIPVSVSLGVCVFLWILCCLCFLTRRLHACLCPCLSLFLVAASLAYYDCRTDSVPQNHLENIVTVRKTLHRITGTIISPPVIWDENALSKRMLMQSRRQNPERHSAKISFVVRAEGIETPSGWKEITGAVKVNLYPSSQEGLYPDAFLPSVQRLVYGQKIELFGHVFLLKPPTNPGEFDYRGFMKRQTPSVRCFMTVVNAGNVKFRETCDSGGLYRFIYALNNALNNAIYTHAFSSSAPLISSMILGNRVDLPGETIDDFMKTGIIHFIAISGFNVGIVVLTVLLPMRLLGVHQTVSTAIILLVIILYAFLTGLNPPVLRASIMATVFFSSALVRRQWDVTSGIFTAVFFILVRNPSDLFNVGFQLSVAATMGIVYGASRIEGALFKTALFIETLQVREERGRFFFFKKYLRKSLCVSLAAWLATMPLTACYFHLFTPFVPIANIIVFPLFWIIIVCGTVLLTLGMALAPLAAAAAWLASYSDLALESLVSTLSSIPYSYFYVAGPSPPEIAVYYAFLVIVYFRRQLSLDLFRIALWGLLSANIFALSGILKSPRQALTVTCLDVGHGGGVVVQFPNGKNLLYDAGTWQGFDAGRSIVSPFLWNRRIKKIDLAIVSHEHEDHWNALPSLMDRFPIKTLYSNSTVLASASGQKIRALLERNRIPAAAIFRGEYLKGFEPAVVKILNPPPFSPGPVSGNDSCCVVKIEYMGHSILLCADVKEQGIESLLKTPSEIKADVLQAPHHGSLINNLDELVRAVQPAYAFINSSENLTVCKTLDVLKNHNAVTLQAHREGAITFTLDKNGVTYTTFGGGVYR